MDEKNKREFTDGEFDLPRPASRPYAPPARRNTDTVDVTESSAERHVTSGGFRIPPAGRDAASNRRIRTSVYSSAAASYSRQPSHREEGGESVTTEYYCAGRLIRQVAVSSWPNSYSFYEKFVRDAHISHSRQGSPAPHTPFFSYIPQYTQLKNDQWAYYLHMREQLRQGQFMRDADFSYVILYIYEVINLEGVYSPAEGAEALARAWSLYRSLHPMLDKYMAEWMADYCLVYNTPLPRAVYPFLAEAAARVTLKEFYVDAAMSGGRDYIGPVLRESLSDYAPERSRYGKDDKSFARDVKQVFDEIIPELMSRGEGLFAPAMLREVKLNRDAYCGSLCSSSAKKKLHLRLQTFMRSPESRRIITELMKSCENIVRARRGIKARLAAPAIGALSVSAVAKTEEEAKYLAFYDSPAEELTPERAAQIESESWQNTEVLTDTAELEGDFDDEVPDGAMTYDGASREPAEESILETVAATEESTLATEDGSLVSALAGADPRLASVLTGCADGGSFGELCRNAGLFADDAASRINELAMDIIGDVVLEQSGTDYLFVEDYTDEIRGS